MEKPWDVGIIPCTKSKWSTGLTPLSLYKGAAFSMMMKHSSQRCNNILIFSAKYGFLS